MPADIRSFFGGGPAKAAPAATKKDDQVRENLCAIFMDVIACAHGVETCDKLPVA